MMWQHLDRGSSPVDWCEDNYSFSPVIAEFFNTISNSIFLIMTPVLIFLHQPYAACMGPGIHLVWILLFIVGASSAYFHATLSLLGQLLDEVAILWVVMTGFAMWFPQRFIPLGLRDETGRKTFSITVLGVTILSTLFGFIAPAINAFFLMTMSIPAACMLIYNLRREKRIRIKNLGRRSLILWILAVACWINDKLLCDIWTSVGFQYLHGFWHVLIFLASYTAVVLFAYFDAQHHFPSKDPVVRFWPIDSFEFGIPFVLLQKHPIEEITNKEHQI